MKHLQRRLDKLAMTRLDASTLSDAELEAIVVNDAMGQWLRSLSDIELEQVAQGECLPPKEVKHSARG